MAIGETHQTADSVFHALLEDWEPMNHNYHLSRKKIFANDGTTRSPENALGLPGWRGICAGLERLNGLLLTLQAYLTFPTASAANTPVGKLVDLVDRILSALPPSGNGSIDTGKGTRINPEIDRDEREMLWTWLPQLHLSALGIVEQLVLRLREGSVALDQRFLDLVLWISDHDHSHAPIREAIYRVIALLLAHCGSGAPCISASSLARCLSTSCGDLVPNQDNSVPSNGGMMDTKTAISKGSISVDAYSKRIGSLPSSYRRASGIQSMAERLLHTALTHLPPEFLSFPIRSKLDQTAVLAQSKLLLQSSVLTPPVKRRGTQHSSLMPFLARQFSQDQCTEALVRPRIPPIQQSTVHQLIDSDEEVEERECTAEEKTRRSPITLDFAQDTASPTTVVPERQATVSFERPENGSVPVEAQPVASSSGSLRQDGTEISMAAIPAKRGLDVDSEDMIDIASDEPQRLLGLGGESASKRICDNTGDIYVSPATKDDLPPPVPSDPPEASKPRPLEKSASSEPFANLRTLKENMEDDESDDSSIPAIDPTWATEDEDEDEEDQEDHE
ncbi:MAG: hypothetical protein Q9166_001165 [cf. Caloplaca sp. 2 TL-2023]